MKLAESGLSAFLRCLRGAALHRLPDDFTTSFDFADDQGAWIVGIARRIGGRRNQQALLDKSGRLSAGRLATRWLVRREGTR